jgi:Tol biopolymer transport system component
MAWAGPSQLIYSATLAGGSGLWAMDIASGTSQLIVPNASAPSVSADGNILVFNKAGREIWRAEADGSRAVRLDEALGSFPRIAPDGSRVYYISARSGVQSTWVVDLAGGAPRQFSPMQTSGHPVASPDGRLVMLASGAVESPGTFIVKAEGGEPVHRLPVLPRRGDIWWTPDGQGLAYIEASSGNIRVQPIDGGPPRSLTALTDRNLATFAWSPDGQQLMFTQQTAASNVVLLKGVR